MFNTNIIICFIYIIVTVLTVIVLNKSKTSLFIALSLILGLMYYSLNLNIYYLIITGIMGALTEGIIFYFTTDLWKYRDPLFFYIQLWLPLLWAIAGGGFVSVMDFSNNSTDKSVNFVLKFKKEDLEELLSKGELEHILKLTDK